MFNPTVEVALVTVIGIILVNQYNNPLRQYHCVQKTEAQNSRVTRALKISEVNLATVIFQMNNSKVQVLQHWKYV